MNYAHIHSILKLRPLFLYWTYELIPIFITFNRTEVSLFKQVNNRHEKSTYLMSTDNYVVKTCSQKFDFHIWFATLLNAFVHMWARV